MQSRKEKITNCFLPFRRVKASDWNEAGERNSQDSRSRALALLFRNPQSAIRDYLVATFISNNSAETEEIGQRFAKELNAGSVLALQGELGSGKTQFTKGLVAALGSSIPVTSPTFTIIHEYPGGRLPVYHFDFFRLVDQESVARLGLDDYLFGDGISVIEWADRFPEFIPEKARWILFEIKSENARAISTK